MVDAWILVQVLILPEKSVGSDCSFFFHLPGSTLLNLGSGIYVPNQHYSWKILEG